MVQEKQMPPYSGACFSPAPLSYSPKLLSVNVFSSVIHHSACKVCHLISHAPQVPADDHAFGASFTQEYCHFSIIYLPHMIPELIIGNIFTSTDPFFFIPFFITVVSLPTACAKVPSPPAGDSGRWTEASPASRLFCLSCSPCSSAGR